MPDPADMAYANRVQQKSDADLARAVASSYPDLDTPPPPPVGGTIDPNFARNQQFAKPGPYRTILSPQQEAQFQQWVHANNVPNENDTATSTYDMRGYWKDIASKGGNQTAVNSMDQQLHFPDTYKTPYHESFSAESRYASPNNPFKWQGETLMDTRTNRPVPGQRSPQQAAAAAQTVEGPGGGETTDVPFGNDPVTYIPALVEAGATGGARALGAGAAIGPLASIAAQETQDLLLKRFPDKPWIANIVGGMLPSLAIMGGAAGMSALGQPKPAPGTVLGPNGQAANAPAAMAGATPELARAAAEGDFQIQHTGAEDLGTVGKIGEAPGQLMPVLRDPDTGTVYEGGVTHGGVFNRLPQRMQDEDRIAAGKKPLEADLFKTPTGKIVDRQQAADYLNKSSFTRTAPETPSAPEGVPAPAAEPAVAASQAPASAKPIPLTPEMEATATPQAAAQTLAQKQAEALTTARVGKAIAAEFGRPELATQIPEAQAMQEAQSLKLNLEKVYSTGVEPPTMSRGVAALAKVFSGEATDLHSTAVDILQRSAAGEDVSADLGNLNNRFSSFAVQYAKIAGQRSEMGRGLEILNPLKPENLKVTETAKLAQQLGEGENPTQLAEMLARLDPDRLARVGRQMAETSDSTPGTAFGNGIMEYYRANLLSNPKTIGRIGLSNAITSMAEIPVRAIAARMPGATVESGEASAMMRGISDGFGNAVRVAGKSFMTGQPEFDLSAGTQFQPNSEPAITGENLGFSPDSVVGKGIDYLGSAIRLPYRGITAVHQFGYAMASSMQLHALAWRQAVSDAADEGLAGSAAYNRANELYAHNLNDPPTDMINAAKEFGQTTTFINKLEGKVPQALQTLSRVPGLNLVVPFFKTPYNIFKYGMDFSPLGVATQFKALTGGPSAARDIALAKVGLGSLMAGIAAHETIQGLLTGDGPDNPDARAALMRQGWQPNSLRIGNKWMEIPEPFRQPLTLVANAVELMNNLDSPTASQLATAVTLATVRSFTNSSFVQGLANLRAAISEASDQGIGTVGERFIGQQAKGFVPFSSGLQALTKAEDPTIRNAQVWLDQIKAGIPGLSKDLPPKRDIYGNVVQGLPGVPENMLYPVRVTEQTHDPVDQAIIDTNASFAKVPKYISGRSQHALDNPNDPDIGVPLSPEQQDRWSKNRGADLKEQLSGLIESDGYKQGSTLMKKQLLEFVGSKYAELATLKLLRDDPKLMAAYVARMQNRSTALLPSDATPTSPEASAE